MRFRFAAVITGIKACTMLSAGSATAGHGADSSGGGVGDHSGGKAFTYAVIGDIPYGDAQIARFPGWIISSTPTRRSDW